MAFDARRCRQIVEQQRANYPYLTAELALRVVGTIMSKRRKKVAITADFEPALVSCNIPLHQRRGYAQVAADYFNQKGSLVKHGSSYGLYPKSKLPHTMQSK